MALNLQTLTSPTTSSDVIADIENPAASGDLVVTLKNLATGSGATTNATQTVSAAQGTAVQGDTSYLVMDLVDDEYEFTTDSAVNGTIVVATLEGTYSANISLDASTQYDLQARGVAAPANYGFLKNPVGYLISSSPLSESEITQMENYFVDKGAAARSAFGSVTDFSKQWRDCSSLTSFPLLDTSSGTDFGSAWYGCSTLTSFPSINTSSGNGLGFKSAWRDCSSLTSFPLLDTSLATNFSFTWFGCRSLTSFPLINTSLVTNFYYAWVSCRSLTSFPLIDTSIGTNFVNTWQSCISLTSFPLIDTSSGLNFTNSWNGCTSLTSFPLIDTSSGTNFSSAWYGCSSLTSFPAINAPSGTDFYRAWRNCTSLTSFSLINPESARRFRESWYSCTSLTTFPANFFDDWSPPSLYSKTFDKAWYNCTSLTAQSVENILTSIDTSGVYGTDTGASGGTQLADNAIDIEYDTATGSLSAATNSAISSLIDKNWEVSINGVLVVPNLLDLAPAAAYSLRSLDADADPNVVNIRRSSDNATSDFTASEVSDGTLTSWVGAGNDGYVTTWYDQRQIVETGSAYGTSLGGSLSGAAQVNHNQLAPAVAGEYYRIRFTASNMSVRGRVRYRSYSGGADVLAVAGLGSLEYFYTDGSYEAYVPSDDGLSLWFFPESGWDYSDVSIQQVAEVPNNATQSTAARQPRIVDAGSLVTEGGNAALDFLTEESCLHIDHSDLHGQSTLDSYYVTNPTDSLFLFPATLSSTANYGMVSQEGSSSANSSLYGSPTFYANGVTVASTRGAVYNATFGGQRLVTHVGADTTNASWSTSTMNFGNYVNNSVFGYTGKLQEMIFFNTDQSANRVTIEDNINNHFNIY